MLGLSGYGYEAWTRGKLRFEPEPAKQAETTPGWAAIPAPFASFKSETSKIKPRIYFNKHLLLRF